MTLTKIFELYFTSSEKPKVKTLVHIVFWLVMLYFNWTISFGSYDSKSGSEVYYYLTNCLLILGVFYSSGFLLRLSDAVLWKALLLGLSFIFVLYFNYYVITLLNAHFIHEKGFLYRYKAMIGDVSFVGIWKSPKVIALTFSTTIYLFYLPLIFKLLYEVFKKLYYERKLKEENMQLELDFLRAQVNPHFLFNTVNNIYSMVLDNERAANSLLRLADLMRYTLYEAGNESVPLKRELEFINEYIDLERLRLPHHKTIHLEIKGDIKTQVIKPLILITFVENAIKHGINMTNGSAHADIKIEIKNNDLVLHCSNSVVADIQPEGLGLSNTLKRLSYYYADRHQYTQTTENGNYTVVLHIAL